MHEFQIHCIKACLLVHITIESRVGLRDCGAPGKVNCIEEVLTHFPYETYSPCRAMHIKFYILVVQRMYSSMGSILAVSYMYAYAY